MGARVCVASAPWTWDRAMASTAVRECGSWLVECGVFGCLCGIVLIRQCLHVLEVYVAGMSHHSS